MEIVQQFKEGIAWYQPTTDAHSWQEFYQWIYSVDYTQATGETLKKAAWRSAKLQTTVDVGMWADRAARLQKFLNSNIGESDYDPLFSKILQYEFVACFLNDFSQAAHNSDLWQSINDSAVRVLQNEMVPADQSALINYQPVHDYPNLVINPKWLLTVIPAIIYTAFKSVNLSYYRPTVDTDTWAYFQNVVFQLELVDTFQFTYRHTYLLSNISSPVDHGMWGTLASGSTAFLDANLGAPPANADEEVELAIKLCKLFQFNYTRAAHNADLFKAYNDSFTTAVQKLQVLIPSP
jgi:hypothetical protein